MFSSTSKLSEYFSNLFILDMNFDTFIATFIPHNHLKCSSTILINLCRKLQQANQLPDDIFFGADPQNNVVAISTNNQSIEVFKNSPPYNDCIKENSKVKTDYLISQTFEYEEFVNILKVLSRWVELEIYRSLLEKNWSLLYYIGSIKAYKQDDKDLLINIPQQLSSIANMYRGVQLKVFPVTLKDPLEREFIELVLSVDPKIIITPIVTMDQIFQNNIRYLDNRIIIIKEVFYYSLSVIRREAWNILRTNNNKIRAFRFKRKTDGWVAQIKDIEPTQAYPFPRPETLDAIAKQLNPKINAKFTRLLKIHSFHITEQGKKDYKASIKRYYFTEIILNKISSIVNSRQNICGTKIVIRNEPIGILTT